MDNNNKESINWKTWNNEYNKRDKSLNEANPFSWKIQAYTLEGVYFQKNLKTLSDIFWFQKLITFIF